MNNENGNHGLHLDSLFAHCLAATGHCCPGQVLGIRMAVHALRTIGIKDPKGKEKKSLMVFVEIDRCATDAIQYVTGCSLGKQTLKFFDYGKMAATFINLKTNEAVRVVAKEQARAIAKELFPRIEDKYLAQTEAYKIMADDDLFETEHVAVKDPFGRAPQRKSTRVPCDLCGEYVQDRKEVDNDGRVLCRACAEGTYYTHPAKIIGLAKIGKMQMIGEAGTSQSALHHTANGENNRAGAKS